jgi:hypothetical protein
LAAPVRFAATPSGSAGRFDGTGGTQAGVVPVEEDAVALAVVAVVEPAAALELVALVALALGELDELLPHAASTQLSTTSAPSARMERHPITRISTSLGLLTHDRPQRTRRGEGRKQTRPYPSESRLSSPIVRPSD